MTALTIAKPLIPTIITEDYTAVVTRDIDGLGDYDYKRDFEITFEPDLDGDDLPTIAVLIDGELIDCGHFENAKTLGDFRAIAQDLCQSMLEDSINFPINGSCRYAW